MKKRIVWVAIAVFLAGLLFWLGKGFFSSKKFENREIGFRYPVFYEMDQDPETQSDYLFTSSFWFFSTWDIFFGFEGPIGEGKNGSRSLEEYVVARSKILDGDSLEMVKMGRGLSAREAVIANKGVSFSESGLGTVQVFFNVGEKVYSYKIVFKNTGGREKFAPAMAKFLAREFVNSLEIKSEGELFSAQEAEKIVLGLDEVLEWGAALGWRRASVVAEGEAEGKWRVHVFESLDDHTATMNWFYVDKETGKVIKEFDF